MNTSGSLTSPGCLGWGQDPSRWTGLGTGQACKSCGWGLSSLKRVAEWRGRGARSREPRKVSHLHFQPQQWDRSSWSWKDGMASEGGKYWRSELATETGARPRARERLRHPVACPVSLLSLWHRRGWSQKSSDDVLRHISYKLLGNCRSCPISEWQRLAFPTGAREKVEPPVRSPHDRCPWE